MSCLEEAIFRGVPPACGRGTFILTVTCESVRERKEKYQLIINIIINIIINFAVFYKYDFRELKGKSLYANKHGEVKYTCMYEGNNPIKMKNEPPCLIFLSF